MRSVMRDPLILHLIGNNNLTKCDLASRIN